jgi:UDP-N-acetylmuramoyl-tripeptide--D-alanyl-D-alanine ligase
MTPIPLKNLAAILGGELRNAQNLTPSAAISGFVTDNREVKPGDLFIAIKGAKLDGHDFAPDALKRSGVAVLAERTIDGPHILVESIIAALAKLGTHFRENFYGPVVGITGSAGKTTTKEFLASALSPLGRIVKTEGNRNTEYTAPLLWPDVTSDTAAVVIELAMRGQGQIAHLASFSQPTVGLVTNIGWSHVSEVGSREGIARAKGELLEALPKDGVAVLPQDDEFYPTLQTTAGARQIYTFGAADAADCRIIGIQSDGWDGSTINGFFADIPWQAHTAYLGSHLAQNVAAAICTAAALGLAPQEAAEALCDAELPPMRMQVLERNGVKILLDAYNASPASMIGAIETFMKLPVDGRRIAILGQMNELGEESERAHRELGEFVKNLDLHAIPYGPLALSYDLGEPFTEIANLKSEIANLKSGDAVLIKGSRSLELERVLQ